MRHLLVLMAVVLSGCAVKHQPPRHPMTVFFRDSEGVCYAFSVGLDRFTLEGSDKCRAIQDWYSERDRKAMTCRNCNVPLEVAFRRSGS